MNIDENAVNHVGGCASAAPVTPCWPSHRTCPAALTRSHSLPGCVSSYGIAP